MKWKFLVPVCLLFAQPALADTKDDFIKKAKEDCQKSDADAEALATQGRTGNVIKWRLCPQNPVDIAPDCKMKCSNEGKVIN